MPPIDGCMVATPLNLNNVEDARIGLLRDAHQRACELRAEKERAAKERDRRDSRLVASFASSVFDAEQAAAVSPDCMLPQSVLAVLLEDPSHALNGTPYQRNKYEEVPVVWQRRPAAPFTLSSSPVLQGMEHETSQLFARPLCFGRCRCFRLHRFRLRSEAALEMMAALSILALQRATSGFAHEDAGGIRGSNVGGFQQLLASDSTLAHLLRCAFTGAVRQVAEAALSLLFSPLSFSLSLLPDEATTANEWYTHAHTHTHAHTIYIHIQGSRSRSGNGCGGGGLSDAARFAAL
jgi:hypothetical protein